MFMKREYLSKNSFFHIIRRGTRGLPIVRDNSDRWRFLRSIYYLNDSSSKINWFRDLEEARENNPNQQFFSWPSEWPIQSPLFSLSAYTLLDNHYHLIGSKTVEEMGISKFMQKSGISMAKHFNEKYSEKGTLFQCPYKIVRIDNDQYLRWVVPYVMVKNTFEMHPKGYKWAIENFEDAWKWAVNYKFSSLGDYAGNRISPILKVHLLQDILGEPKEFKKLCRDMIFGRKGINDDIFSEIKILSFEE